MSNTVKAPRKRGRIRTPQSIAMSRNIVKMRAEGLTLQAIADHYNGEKRRREASKTLTAQAVYARLQSFKVAFPAEFKEIVAEVRGTSKAKSKKALPAADTNLPVAA